MLGAYRVAMPQAKAKSTRRNIPVILSRSAMVRLKDTSMVPSASLAGMMKEKRPMLMMVPRVKRMSDSSSGSGTQVGVHTTEHRTQRSWVSFCTHHNRYSTE